MKMVIPAYQRYLSNLGWLRSYFLFSFADYHDPENMHWGDLRVFNDDTISPRSGFGLHAHKEMEIVTIVLSGTVTHEDSMGNQKKISAGMVQRMSAGTGVRHSEYNHEDEPLHLYQIWILPKEEGLLPEYEEATFEGKLKENGLTRLAGEGGLLNIHANASIFYGKLEKGKNLECVFAPERYVELYVSSGEVKLLEVVLEPGDQLRLHEEELLNLIALEDAEFILIETT